MKKLVGAFLFLFCLSLPPWLGAQTPVFGIELDRFFEANIADFPPAPPTGTIRIALDGASGTDCVTGSGSTRVICRWTGSAWESIGGGGGGGAPTTATYITQIPDAGLSAEQPLDALASGIMRSDTATGVITTLVDSAGLAANLSDEVGNAGGFWRGSLTSPAVNDVLVVTGISPTVLGNATLNMLVANEGATGTTVNKLAKLTGAPSTAIIASSGDTGGVVGLVIAGAGTTGNAELRVTGIAQCDFDGAATAGNYVQISNSVAGECTDAGSSYPTSEQVIGIVTQTIGAAGLANVVLFAPENRDQAVSGSISFSFELPDPVDADDGLLQHKVGFNFTVTRLSCSTDTGTIPINVDERVETTPNTAGVNVLSADLVCDTNSQTSCAAGCDVNTITNGPIDADDPIGLILGVPSGSPTIVRVHVTGTID